MGRADNVQKEFMSSNERFADVFNYYLYNGRRVIKPEELTERRISEIVLPKDKAGQVYPAERLRDMLKGCVVRRGQEAIYLLLGLENYDEIHYAMPVKHMLYDAMNYASQVSHRARQHRHRKDTHTSAEFLSGFTKEDKLLPVVTLAIYWGDEAFDAPRSLHEMFETKNRRLLKYVDDYHLHLVIPQEIHDFTRFRSDLGKILGLVKMAGDKETLRQLVYADESYFANLDAETAALLQVCFNVKIKDKGGKRNMCKAIDDIFQEGIERGIEQGIERGIDRGQKKAKRRWVV